MSRPLPPVDPAAPLVQLAPQIRCGAGSSVEIEVIITHRGESAAWLTVTVLGLDSSWVPATGSVGPVEPGVSVPVWLSIEPERGALGAGYPFVVAVEATPLDAGLRSVIGIAESVLAVDARDPITITVSPQTPSAVFSRGIKVQLTNPGHQDRELLLTADAARGASIRLTASRILIRAGRTVTVPGRVRVSPPRMVGSQTTHTFVVAARGQGAPEFAEGSLRSRPVLGGRVTALIAAVAALAIWATAAIVFIPKISDSFSGQTAAEQAAEQFAPGASMSSTPGAAGGTGPAAGGTGSAAAGGTAASGGSGGSAGGGVGSSGSAGGTGTSGAGGNGAGGSGSGGSSAAGTSAGGSASGGGAAITSAGSGSGAPGAPGTPGISGGSGSSDAAGAQLSGTVTGPSPKGVSVSLEPATLVDAADQGAQAGPGTAPQTAQQLRDIQSAIGKIPESALRLAPAAAATGVRTTSTDVDGTFSFAGITSPGYYLLILSMPGFQTRRFIVDSAQLAAGTPMKVALTPGDGALSGHVTGPNGPVGAATVTITDGTVSLQTSTVSPGTSGTPGSWTVNGLSTPGSYLVTVSAPGLGTESALVSLAAGGTAAADLTMSAGVAAITGTITGRDELGRLGGLGGVTVTATGTSRGVSTTRTATTVTSGPVGTYSLPDLPVPGDYTVTVSGAGYAAQTRTVSLAVGAGNVVVNMSLTRADGVVNGTVIGTDPAGHDTGGLIGAGLTLTGNTNSYKTMSTSSPAGGFQFTGVPPGIYVLTASQYGRIPSSATVVVQAAQTISQTLRLQSAPNTQLPATSRIRGRAVDARTSGALTCDRAVEDNPTCVLTATVPANNAGTDIITTTVGPAEDYTLPSLQDKTHTGLTAGLYAVTLSAPGYEPATVQVQVAQGQISPAPQVALQPLGLISGTVTTKIGTPTQPSCVVAVPSNKVIPVGCVPGAGVTCTTPGAPAARCTMTDAKGFYQIRGLVHGGYQVVVIPRDTEYRPTPPLAVPLPLGGDFRYDPVLNRLGRAVITLLTPDLQTLDLGAVEGATVTVTDSATGQPAGTPLPGGGTTTGGDGSITLTKLTGTFTFASRQSQPDGVVSGTLADVPIADNQVITQTLVLTETIGAAVGHVSVNVDGVARDLKDATVTVTGVVGFSGSTRVSGSATVTTDSHGCYAIIPADWDLAGGPALIAGACTTAVDPASVARLTVAGAPTVPRSLVAYPLALTVLNSATVAYASAAIITGTGQVKVIPEALVKANPSAVLTNLPLTLRSIKGTDFPDPSTSQLQVTRQPAGAGAVTATGLPGPQSIDNNGVRTTAGRLSMNDASLSVNALVPGRYTVVAAQLGFATSTADLWCDLGTPCTLATFDAQGNLLKVRNTFDANGDILTTDTGVGFEQNQLPSISGVVRAPGADLLGVALDQTLVTVTGQPTASGSLSTAVTKSANPADPNFGTISVTDGSLPDGLAQPGNYSFSLSLPGFFPTTNVSVQCATDFLATTASGNQGCDPLNVTLDPLPVFTGSVELDLKPGDPAEDITGLTVTVAGPITGVSVTPGPLNTINTWSLAWQEPGQPAGVVTAGSYSLTFQKPDFDPVTVPFSCDTTSCDLGTVTLELFPHGGGTITADSPLVSGQPIDWTKAVVTFGSAPDTLGTLTASVAATGDTTGRFVWNDTSLPATVIHPGTYVLNVTLPGYAPASTGPFTCVSGTTCDPTLTLGRLPGFDGTVTVVSTLNPDPSGGLNGVQIKVTDKPKPTSNITVGLATTVGTTSALIWSDDSQPAGVVDPGNYTLQFSKVGYLPVTVGFSCLSGSVCHLGTVTLDMYPAARGTVAVNQLLPDGNPIDWSKATVKLINEPPAAAGLAITVSADSPTAGHFIWQPPPPTFAGTTPPGTYSLSVSLPGYGTVTSPSFVCTAGQSCGPALLLGQLATFSGTAAIDPTVTTTPAQNLSGITVTVTPPPDAARPSVSVDATTGALSWADPSQPAGIVAAGAYTLVFKKAGYQDTSSTFSCSATQTVCGPGTVTVPMLPGGAGSVTVSDLPAGATVDWTKAAITLTRPAAAGSLGLTLVGRPGSANVADLVWLDPTLPYAGTTAPGSYSVTVSIPGYGSATSAQFSCAAGSTCGPNLTLSQLPTFRGTVVTNPAGGTLTGAGVSVVVPADVKPVTATVAADGTVSWQETGAPAGLVSYGTYSLTPSLTGYVGQTVSWTCTATSCPAVTLTLTEPSQLTIATVSSATGHPAVNAAQFTVTGSTITGSTVSAPATSNSVSFPALSPFGTYQAEIHAPGFATAKITGSSTSTVTCVNGETTKAGLAVLPGGTTTCTVTLTQIGTVVGAVTGVAADGTATALDNVTVRVQRILTNPDSGAPILDGQGKRQLIAPAFSGVSNTAGTVSITGTLANEGLVAGLWQVTATQTGYTPLTGSVKISDTFAMAASGLGDALTITGGRLQVALKVIPVVVQVHLNVDGVDALPAVTLTLSGPGGHRSCAITSGAAGEYSCANGPADTVVSDRGKYTRFAGMTPGVYRISVSSAGQNYSTLTQWAQVVVGLDQQQLVLSLAGRSAGQAGTVRLADNRPADAATTVSLRIADRIAADQDGRPLTQHVTSGGRFAFSGVPAGSYQLVAAHSGYVSAISTVVVGSSGSGPPVALQLTARSTRSLQLRLTSTARPAGGGAVDLAATVVALHPPAAVPGLSADPELSSITMSSAGSAEVPQVGTGTWSAEVVSTPMAPFGAGLTSDTVVVPESAGPGDATATLTLQQSLATLVVAWPDNSCLSPPASGSLPLSLSRNAGPPVTVTAAVTGHRAVAQVYLPAGSYRVAATPAAAGWTGSAATFSVGTHLTAPASVSPAPLTLAAATVPVTVSMTVDGDPALASGVSISTADGTRALLQSDGTASLCLPAGHRAALTPSSADGTVRLPGQSIDVSDHGPNRVSFAGYRLSLGVSEQLVPGRAVDGADRTVGVSLASTNRTVWSGSLTLSAGASSVTGPTLIVDAGTKTLTATPAAGGAFGPITVTADPRTTHVLAGVLPYRLTTLSVLVTRGGAPQVGATVTLMSADGTSRQALSAANGVAEFPDLPAGNYAASASWSDAGTAPATEYHADRAVTAGGASSATLALAP